MKTKAKYKKNYVIVEQSFQLVFFIVVIYIVSSTTSTLSASYF